MTNLTGTQCAVLTAAAQRPNLAILPLPDRLKAALLQRS